jgi:hypothetical protein
MNLAKPHQSSVRVFHGDGPTNYGRWHPDHVPFPSNCCRLTG